MWKILVTGSSGLIGSAAVEYFDGLDRTATDSWHKNLAISHGRKNPSGPAAKRPAARPGRAFALRSSLAAGFRLRGRALSGRVDP
jgi:nucleoside-diphosphate-sugar epimerase